MAVKDNLTPLEEWAVADLFSDLLEGKKFTGTVTVNNGKTDIIYEFRDSLISSIVLNLIEKKETK